TAIRGDDAHIVGYVGAVTDIHRGKQAESAWRGLVQSLPDPVLVCETGIIVYANPAMEELLRYGAGELVGAAVDAIVPDEERDAVRRRSEIVAAGSPVPKRRARVLRKDGTQVWVEASGAPSIYAGKPAAISVFRDLTERSQTALRLRSSVEGVSDAFTILDAVRDGDGRVVD